MRRTAVDDAKVVPASGRSRSRRVMTVTVLLWHASAVAVSLGWIFTRSTAWTTRCGFDCVPREEAILTVIARGVPGLAISLVVAQLMVRSTTARTARLSRARARLRLGSLRWHDVLLATGLTVASAVAAAAVVRVVAPFG